MRGCLLSAGRVEVRWGGVVRPIHSRFRFRSRGSLSGFDRALRVWKERPDLLGMSGPIQPGGVNEGEADHWIHLLALRNVGSLFELSFS
jgi:hypothetical protein